MSAAISLRVYTGTNAGTESAAQTAIALLSVDAATDDPNSHEIAAGANSFEKWVRVKIDTSAGTTLTNFSIERTGDLADGVVIRMGVTDNPVTPTSRTSTVATTTMVAGRRYVFDATPIGATGAYSRYLVIQAQCGPQLPNISATAPSGAIEQQVFTISYQESPA